MEYIKKRKGESFVVKIDPNDIELYEQYNWHITADMSNTRYLYRTVRQGKDKSRKHIKFHRIILGLSGIENRHNLVDHINGDGLDNRRINLRIVTASQNTMNSKKRKAKSSIYKGVSFDRRDRKFRAQICIDGKLRPLGYFKTEEEAALAYNKAALELFGEYANLNEVV